MTANANVSGREGLRVAARAERTSRNRKASYVPHDEHEVSSQARVSIRYRKLQRDSLAACDDFEQVANLVVEAALDLIPGVDGAVYERIDGEDVVITACSGTVARFAGQRMPIRGSLSAGIKFSGRAFICDNLQYSCPVIAAACRRFGIASLILVPTIIGGQVQGVLKLASHRPFAFSSDDLVTGELLAYPLCVALHADDARQQRETSAVLHRRLQAMFEQAAVGVAHVHLDGRLLRINDRFAEIVGWPRQDLEKQSFQTITHADDIAADLANLVRLRRGEIDRYAMEKRCVGADGSIRWARLTVNLIEAAQPEENFFVVVLEDIGVQRRAQEDARIDPLTRLPNRAFVTEYLPGILAASTVASRGIGLAYVDLDGFKAVNDAHGHFAGDECLIDVSRALRSSIGSRGLAARMSGDEFLLIFPDVPEDEFERCIVAAKAAISELGDTKGWSITASVGSVFCGGADRLDATAMMHLADERMYAAKRADKAARDHWAPSSETSGWF